MREEVDVRGSSRAQRRRRSVGRDQRAKRATPRPDAHDTPAWRPSDPFDAIGRDDDTAFEPKVGRRKTAKSDDLAAVITADLYDLPPRAADQYEIARTDVRAFPSVIWRNLHRASATRAQNLRGAFRAPLEIKNLRRAKNGLGLDAQG
jgi:hypothetical protein